MAKKSHCLKSYFLLCLLKSLAYQLCFCLKDFTSLAIDGVEFIGDKVTISFFKLLV